MSSSTEGGFGVLRPVPDDEETVPYLEEISHLWHTVMNDGDFAYNSANGLRVRRHIAHDFLCYIDNFPKGITFEEGRAIMEERAKQGEPTAFDIVSTWSDLDAARGRATVFLMVVTKGWKESRGAGINALIEMNWRRSAKHWTCYKYSTVRNGDYDM